MEKWHERLRRRVRLELGWTAVEFAKRSGQPVENIYKYLRGEVKRPPDDEVINAMAGAVGWAPAKLMYDVAADSQADDGGPSMRRIPQYPWGDVEMLTARAKAAGVKAPKVVNMLPVPDDRVSADAFYTTAPDDSNAPEINKGDLLLCEPNRDPIPDHYVIAKIAGYPAPILAKYTVKTYHKGVAAEVALVPYNLQAYGSHHAKASDVEIVGLVTHRTHRLAPPVS